MLGNLALACPDAVAIVGARHASAAGPKIAGDMAAELGRAGLTLVSGLGGGIDHIYPPQHERLYREIAEEGLIVSESPTG